MTTMMTEDGGLGLLEKACGEYVGKEAWQVREGLNYSVLMPRKSGTKNRGGHVV